MPIVKDREAYHVESTLSRRPREENKSVEGKKLNQQHLWKVVKGKNSDKEHLWKEDTWN